MLWSNEFNEKEGELSRKVKKPKIDLPHSLIEAVKNQRAVIVFGAGASMECKESAGKAPPSGSQLRDHLAKKFLGTTNELRDLATVAEMAIANGAGEPIVFDEIASLFNGFAPSPSHIKVADFRWRGLATTNYDDFIEKGYERNINRKQTCLPFVKNAEPYDERLRSVPQPLPLLKVHGCINHRLDTEIPLVLSHEHYSRYQENREHLFERLQHWAQASPLIFIGYSLADPHLRSLIYKIAPQKRPQWFIVSPNADEHDNRFWASKSVDVVACAFSDFIDALDEKIPEHSRALSIPTGVSDAPYTRFFRTSDVGSVNLQSSLQSDLEHVHGGMAFDEVEPAKFYAGHDRGWCGVIRNYDFSRKVGENLLYAALDESDTSLQRFFLLQGSAGAGKTITLRRAAFNAATALDEMVFWLRETGQPRAEVFEELYSHTGKHAMLFVDKISIHGDAILQLLRKLKAKRVPITIVAAERQADWGSYCLKLEEDFPPILHFLRRLNEREAEDLVDLLARHNCLGLLKAKAKTDRIAAFLDKDRADRQLLVALHELTQGKPFEQIIKEEFENITPDSARQLYLDVATMHQFGVVARAGAISRISGIQFSDFEEELFAPLIDIVNVINDPYSGDKGYECRHTRVSGILFEVACLGDVEKSSQLSRILTGVDVGFSSDRRILENICKGRVMAQQFSDIGEARRIFDTAIDALPNSAFLYQQAAILEYGHDNGSLDRSQALAEDAHKLEERNHIYLHTLAEVARRKADDATSTIASEMLRAQSRSYLNKILLKDSRKDLTFCKLLIDEAIDLLRNLPEKAKDHELIEFDEKVAEAVARLRRAQQEFPNEAEFPSAEGYLWQRLGEEQKAAQALAKAIAVRPRNSGAFSRLTRIQRVRGCHDDAIKTLVKALEDFPKDKNIHLQAALLKIESRIDDPDIEYHFRSSYSPGDNNFDARYFWGEFLFLSGRVLECKDIFEEIDAKSPKTFRRSAPASDDVITERLGKFSGTIKSVKDRYFFIHFGGYPSQIFSHISSLSELTFDELSIGMPVYFRLRFNRKGPVAVFVSPLV